MQAPTIGATKSLVKSLGESCPILPRSMAAIRQKRMKTLEQLSKYGAKAPFGGLSMVVRHRNSAPPLNHSGPILKAQDGRCGV